MNVQVRRNPSTLFFFLFTLAILLLIGFAGYYFGFLGFIYKIMLPEAFSNFSLVKIFFPFLK